MKPTTECVDYLSFTFDEMDLHACWKEATKHKDCMVNGRRLENASWRRFFQIKYHLPTVDPATLNWHKDSDAVWLYGPFHSHTITELEQKVIDLHETQKQHNRWLKSALKKSPGDLVSIFTFPRLTRTTSDQALERIKRSTSPVRCKPAFTETTRSPVNFFVSDAEEPLVSEKHIRFSHLVRQRVILNPEQVDKVFENLEKQSNSSAESESMLVQESAMLTKMKNDTAFLAKDLVEHPEHRPRTSLTTAPCPPTFLNDEDPYDYPHHTLELPKPVYTMQERIKDTVVNIYDMARFTTALLTSNFGFLG